MVESRHEAVPALDEASEKDGGDDGEEEVASPVATYAQAVVGLEAVRSYFRAKDNPGADKSLQCLAKELLVSKGRGMRQQTLSR